MSQAIETLTWDIEAADGGPQRPSLEQLGGATLIDDAEYPPDPETMPHAAMLNQLQKQVAADGRIVDSLKLSVAFSGVTPFVISFTCPRTGLSISDFTVTHNGTGDTTITWPADTFPPALTQPTGTVNDDVGELVGITVVIVTNGVRVRTYSAAGPLSLAFTIARG